MGNFLRRIALPASVKHWTLTTLRDKLIKRPVRLGGANKSSIKSHYSSVRRCRSMMIPFINKS
jgi:hypothetical protein